MEKRKGRQVSLCVLIGSDSGGSLSCLTSRVWTLNNSVRLVVTRTGEGRGLHELRDNMTLPRGFPSETAILYS